MTKKITARETADLLGQGHEIAFLDVREPRPFSEGHPLFAVPCPWSGLEAKIAALVQRRTVPVVLIDGGDGIATKAALALEPLGYGDVSVVDGGTAGWEASGLTLFKGVQYPSKTLGELVEEEMHPGALSPGDLAEWQSAGRDFAFYDTRPAGEHQSMTVPGAACLPNGELPHRLAMVPEDVPIVLTCAGRTWGIIGAASLTLVAPDRDVRWLEDGTQGWTLSGRVLRFDNETPEFRRLDGDEVVATRRGAEDFIARHGLDVVSPATIRQMCAEQFRTTYLFDVRSPNEAENDPLPGFVPAPVVELVQATDRRIGVRNARIVLADDLGLRAGVAAFWLRAMGFELAVSLITNDLCALQPARPQTRGTDPVQRISAQDAVAQQSQKTAMLIDVRSSADFASGHALGAIWSIRSRLSEIPAVPPRVLLVGDRSPSADLAARTLLDRGRTEVFVIDGGLPALVAAGAELGKCAPMEPSMACDVTSFAHERHDGNEDASRPYLAWEKGLVAQLNDAKRAAFRL